MERRLDWVREETCERDGELGLGLLPGLGPVPER